MMPSSLSLNLNTLQWQPAVRWTNHERARARASPPSWLILLAVILLVLQLGTVTAEADKAERFLDRINEQSIAAVFNKVAYGSTTKRSIPDNVYLYTTLATPLLTTYRYSDGNQEWYRVDVKEPEPPDDKPREEDKDESLPQERDRDNRDRERDKNQDSYGTDLEKDHVLPTSAPAADILKNNHNKHYSNPNRYNNDRLRPDIPPISSPVSTTSYPLRNVRPTKSMFSNPSPMNPNPIPPGTSSSGSIGGPLMPGAPGAPPGREPPSYVPPSRSFFTPPLPPEYLNPFADKPTLRGTNSESYQNRRPIPPPSLMPKKDRIPFRPDLPPSVNNEPPPPRESQPLSPPNPQGTEPRKKTLNTPSQNVHLDRLGEFYGLNRLHNESNFEYEPMVYIPSISRILSGSNGRKEDIPDILLRTVTATPSQTNKEVPKIKQEVIIPQIPVVNNVEEENQEENIQAATIPKTDLNRETKLIQIKPQNTHVDTTTASGDILNLPNVKIKTKNEVLNTTKANNGHEIWHICWNVHIYLVVILYVMLAIFSIVKLVRFERDSHMFSKSYFLSIHLLLTFICVLRIFYLTYDPYNINQSFGNFTYEMLHNLPLSVLATTFAVLIVFLLKRTLNHLKVKNRPMFLVLFGLAHFFICFVLNLAENFNLFERRSFLGLICKFVYILLCWSLGLSYVYLYKIIKNVLAKKSQNISEICTQNISYASHITIAIALLFTLLGFVQLYGLFFIKIDRFIVPYHWILWGFELSVRLLEITIITLLAIVVSLKMSQREKQNVGFPLFPCTTSDSSTDNIYPNNCSTNLNALNYSLRSQQYRPNQQQQDLSLDNIPTDIIERPNLLLEKKNLEPQQEPDQASLSQPFERFERPNWSIERESLPIGPYERSSGRFEAASHGSSHGGSHTGSGRLKPYEKCRYYAKPKYDSDMYNSSAGPDDEPKMMKRERERERERDRERDRDGDDTSNVYSEPLDLHPSSSSDYERSRFSDMDPDLAELPPLRSSSRQSWSNSGRRSTGGRRPRHSRAPHPGVHTLPAQSEGLPGHHKQSHVPQSMLVDENGFVRFRALAGEERRRYEYSDA